MIEFMKFEKISVSTLNGNQIIFCFVLLIMKMIKPSKRSWSICGEREREEKKWRIVLELVKSLKLAQVNLHELRW